MTELVGYNMLDTPLREQPRVWGTRKEDRGCSKWAFSVFVAYHKNTLFYIYEKYALKTKNTPKETNFTPLYIRKTPYICTVETYYIDSTLLFIN